MIFVYHEIRPQATSAYHVSCQEFADHLECLEAYRNTDSLTKPLITFDDGEISQHRYALELLERHAVKAMFFVNVGLIGTTTTIKGTRQEFMTWGHLQELLRLGHNVQSHGWSHELLTLCSQFELQMQVVRSRRVLEDKLGTSVQSLAVPGGRWNNCVIGACADAGYTRVYTSDAWLSERRTSGALVRGRLTVGHKTHRDTLERFLRTRSADMIWLRLQSGLKSSARRLVGENMYHTVWRLIKERTS